jgi:hypothetical protein
MKNADDHAGNAIAKGAGAHKFHPLSSPEKKSSLLPTRRIHVAGAKAAVKSINERKQMPR